MSADPFSPQAIKAALVRRFKLQQLTITPQASTDVCNFIIDKMGDFYDPEKYPNPKDYLTYCIDLIVSTTLQITKDQHNVHNITHDVIKQVCEILSSYQTKQTNSDGQQQPGTAADPNQMSDDVDLAIKFATLKQIQPIYVLDPFNATQFKHALDQDLYIPDPVLSTKTATITKQLHSGPQAFSKMYTDRYYYIYSRLQRQQLALQQRLRQQQLDSNNIKGAQTNTTSNAAANAANHTIYQVDSLRGSSGELTVFGYVSDIVGQLHIESPSCAVMLDISNVQLYDTEPNTRTSPILHDAAVPALVGGAGLIKGDADGVDTRRGGTALVPKEERVKKHSVFSKLFTVGCFLIFRGYMQDDYFIARRCILPSHEPSKVTLSLYPSLQYVFNNNDYLSNKYHHFNYQRALLEHENHRPPNEDKDPNGPNATLRSYVNNNKVVDITTFLKNQQLLLDALQESLPTKTGGNTLMTINPTGNHNDDYIAILGEVYLHDPTTIDKLHSMFQLFESQTLPKFIIFTGNYISPQFYMQNRYNPMAVKKLFDKLADMIYGYKNLRQYTHFIFANGTYDFSFGPVLPVPPLPPSFTHRLTKNITHVTFTSNLIDMRYFGRSLKIYRGDLYHSIYQRDTSLFGNPADIAAQDAENTKGTDDDDIQMEEGQTTFMSELVIKHLTSQSTFLTDCSKTVWEYVQPYNLMYLPDMVFLVDTPPPWASIKYDTIFYNVGCFTGNWHIAIYYPARHRTEPAFIL